LLDLEGMDRLITSIIGRDDYLVPSIPQILRVLRAFA